MAQKDMREKLLEDYNDVFSDIFNGLLFEENVIEQQYLKAGSTESIYKTENGTTQLILLPDIGLTVTSSSRNTK